MGTILAFVSAFTAAMQAIPTLIAEIQNLQKALQSAALQSLLQKIQNDTNALQAGPTTDAQKDAAAKALASDTAHL